MISKLEDVNDWESRWKDVSEPTLQLHRAAASGSPDDIKAMISSGTNVDARDGLNMTPLMSAAYNERLDNILILLEAGADVNAKNEDGKTALHVAAFENSPIAAKALLVGGADINCRDNEGYTPILNAAGEDCLEMVKLLFEAGADISLTGENGLSLIETAEDNICGECSEYLHEQGVEGQSEPKSGQSASVPEAADLNAEIEWEDDDLENTNSIETDAFAEWAGKLAGKSKPVKLGDLLQKLELSEEFKGDEYWMELSLNMANRGFGLAPHHLLLKKPLSVNDSVFLYESRFNLNLLGVNSDFCTLIFNLGIAAFVCTFGKFNAREMRAALWKYATIFTKHNENQMAGIFANIEFLCTNPTILGGFFKTKESENMDETLRLVAVTVINGFEVGKAKKLAALEKFYQFIKLDPELAHSDLQTGIQNIMPG